MAITPRKGFFDVNDSILPSYIYDAVTPSDTVDLPGGVCRSLLIAVGGTLSVIRSDGNQVDLTVPAGMFYGYVARVRASGTAATGITAMY